MEPLVNHNREKLFSELVLLFREAGEPHQGVERQVNRVQIEVLEHCDVLGLCVASSALEV